jgi:hypothetical protein
MESQLLLEIKEVLWLIFIILSTYCGISLGLKLVSRK